MKWGSPKNWLFWEFFDNYYKEYIKVLRQANGAFTLDVFNRYISWGLTIPTDGIN